MPISSGGTNTVGDSARLFPWQVSHYIVRGGPNDPVVQTGPATPAAQTTGGSLSYNSTLTQNPVPGQQPPTPRTMVLQSGGALAAGQLTGNTGGILIGTVPQGAWIVDTELFCYQALAGGTSTSIGVFWTPASTDVTYPPPTLNLFGSILTPVINTLYGVKSGSGITAFSTLATLPLGPGNAVAAGTPAALASLSDIDVYVVSFVIAGTGTPAVGTAGVFSCIVEFSGLEG